MIKNALLALFLMASGLVICQPRAVGIWLAMVQSGYDYQTMQALRQPTLFDFDPDNDQKRYNP